MRAAAGQWSDDFCAATAPASDGGPPTASDGGGDARAHDDGGSGTGGSDAGTTPPPKSGCACDVTPAAPFRGAPLIAALVLIAGLRRRMPARPGKSPLRFPFNRV
jgi:MYXO-CTERM domain-containing protein